jgi:phosphate:Na+ symporter
MTTIGLVSAGLLIFSQGLGLVFGATVPPELARSAIGVRVSLSSYAPPMIFAGSLLIPPVQAWLCGSPAHLCVWS